ncbi:MAG: PLP-dependent aminotransferase family protein [Spirochaetes bacterium]|nr:PLP-dependent aminotransferase family protein [Spirochaetota bacterium]
MIWIDIDRNSNISITNQLFQKIRSGILTGELPGGSRLPSTREMSDNLKISRNIILNVYEQLTAEGYIITSAGTGTFVVKGLVFSDYKNSVYNSDNKNRETKSESRDLTGGIPDLKEFPVKKWKQCYTDILNSADYNIFNYPAAGGENCFKQEIAKYLARNRGILANPENIFITGGSMDNFRIISELLCSHNRIAIENPVLKAIQNLFTSKGKILIPVRTVMDGMDVNSIMDKDLDFIFTTPSHQYPLAVTLSAEKRIELIRRATDLNTYIVEDDYDTEFRYTGNRISSLYSLSQERVIYSGTFSKSLAPALRIAFMILPDSLLEKARNHFKSVFITTNKIEQLIMSEFILRGYFEKHIYKMKKLYGSRFRFLVRTISEKFGDEAVLHSNGSGLHAVLEFKNFIFTESIIRELNADKITVETVNMHLINNEIPDNRIIISFSNNDEKSIADSLSVIKTAVSSGKQ